MTSLEGKVAIVTGAGSGIGREAALYFAAAGASVMAVDRDGATVATVAKEASAAGHVCAPFEADISEAEQVAAMVTAATESFGGLDCAFNQAGAGHPPKPMADLTEEEIDTALAVNFKGTWNCIQREVEWMREHGGGAIVNTSSAIAQSPTKGVAAYGATKRAIIYFSQVAALEYAELGIRVNAIAPGATVTPGFDRLTDKPMEWREQLRADVPMGRLGKPIDIARAAAWLCSDESSYVTGEVLRIDGGARHLNRAAKLGSD